MGALEHPDEAVWGRTRSFLGGSEPEPAEWIVDSKAVAEAARIGARLRLTLYSPRQVMRTRKEDVPANKALRSVGRGDIVSAPKHKRAREADRRAAMWKPTWGK
jgi:hypothetical protein